MFAASGSIGGIAPVCAPTNELPYDPSRPDTVDEVESEAYGRIVSALQKRDFDIIHFNALHFLPLLHAASFDAPTVAVLHTPPFAPLDKSVAAAGPSVAIVSVSQSLAETWPDLGSAPLIIDNGVDLTRFPFGRPSPDFVFAVWSGRIVPEKGLHLAMDAARLAGIPLRIAGPISNRAYWDEMIMPRLGEDSIYVGHLSQAALAALVGAAMVAICTPRWEEPFGLVVVEALACGTPVAGFARGALPDILDETCGALAPADDVEGLARAIDRCLLLDRRACRTRAEAAFDAEIMVDRYEAVYWSLVNTTSETPRLDILEGEAA